MTYLLFQPMYSVKGFAENVATQLGYSLFKILFHFLTEVSIPIYYWLELIVSEA